MVKPISTEVQGLIEALKDESKRKEAGWALVHIGEAAVPALIELLGEVGVHRRAVEVMSRMGDAALPASIRE